MAVNRRVILGAASLSARAFGQSSVRDRFPGTWKLLRYQAALEDGRILQPFGATPEGQLIYTHGGRVSAQVMRSNRHTTIPAGATTTEKADRKELQGLIGGYIAYWGRYELNEPASEVVHHVDGCLVPSWIGTDLVRKYRFSENILTLRLPASTSALFEIVWERQAD